MDFEQKYQKDPGMNKDKDSKLFPQGVTCLFRVEEKEVQLQTTLMQVTRENTLKKFLLFCLASSLSRNLFSQTVLKVFKNTDSERQRSLSISVLSQTVREFFNKARQ